MVPTAPDGFMEVFVSAVDTAGHFWVQVVGPKSTELDKLVEDMTNYYSDETNRQKHLLKKVSCCFLIIFKRFST